MREFQNTDVMERFLQFEGIRGERLWQLREMIFDVAESDDRIGPLSEQLRWGDPGYITEATKAGSIIRLGLFGKSRVALFFHCRTTLVESFRGIYADRLEYSKNRAVLIDPDRMPGGNILSHCVHMSLTYKLKP